MTSIPTLSPRLVGQAEHAHRALLERLLRPSGRTYREWVALSLLASGPRPIARSELVETMRNALKADDAEVGRTVEELQVAGLIERGPDAPGRVGLSASGRQLHERIATGGLDRLAPVRLGPGRRARHGGTGPSRHHGPDRRRPRRLTTR